MDKKLVWSILGMEPTVDEEQLKKRYHELLIAVNPEDDPEGFKRLREAYEEAVSLAHHQTEEEEKPKDEIDLWLDRANEIYHYKDTRNDVSLWEELFKDDLCIALDTSIELRSRFIEFLMGHAYVNQEVWKAIDAEFQIVSDMKNLKENFPKDFLEFVEYNIQNQSFFEYDLLQVLALDESEIDLDNYISGYLRCKTEIDQGNQEHDENYYEALSQSLSDLHSYEVYHPYEDVERIRLLLMKRTEITANQEAENEEILAKTAEVDEQIAEISEKVLSIAPEDTYILYWCGCADWDTGKKEAAFEKWSHVVELLPKHYTARREMAKYYLETQEYQKSKDIIMDLLEENSRDEIVLRMMQEANVPLMEHFTKLAQEEDYTKNMIEACWCKFQNENFHEALAILETLNIKEEDYEYYDYVNMSGRCYLGMDKYAEALPFLLKWKQAWNNLVDDGSEKYKKRKERDGFIHCAIGMAYLNLKQYETAESYLVYGISKEQEDCVRLSFKERLVFSITVGVNLKNVLMSARRL